MKLNFVTMQGVEWLSRRWVGEMRFTPPLISFSLSPCFSFELLDWLPCNCLSSSQPEMSCGLKRKVRQVKQGKPDKSRSGQLLQQHIFVGTTRAFEAAFNQGCVKQRNADHLVHVVTMNNKNTSKRIEHNER